VLDRLREDLPRLVQAATGVEHMVDLGPVLGPLLDLVENYGCPRSAAHRSLRILFALFEELLK
jgi:hypothetical protein